MKNFFPELRSYVGQLVSQFDQIDEGRKKALRSLGGFILVKQRSNALCQLTFICTHNSRRSHLGQIWAETAAIWYGLENIKTFSGGTEATAFNIRAVAALARAGFDIENTGRGKDTNPNYWIRPGQDYEPKRMFSKKFDHLLNPSADFAAVMVCSHADENCPFVPGAEKRFSITYDDPKEFDGTAQEKEKYDLKSLEIGREMFFAMDYVNNLLKNNN